MCFSAGASAAPPPPEYQFVNDAGDVVPENTKGAVRRLKPQPQYTSIMGGTYGGSDSAGNSVGVGNDASGNGNAGSSASGW